MIEPLKIGTRESELAVWQATQVQTFLKQQGFSAVLVFINSEGDVDLTTPLYEMGVQGIFTKTLDTALLNLRIDIAVHSMKDVPTQLPPGIRQAAVLQRGSFKDLLVLKDESATNNCKVDLHFESQSIIATSSIRRKAQWLHRYPDHTVENLRGNINTRLKKLKESNWQGAIFAAAGLERINLRPPNAVELDWMLPAPAQGAIMVVCRKDDEEVFAACQLFNHKETALCTKIEKDFLRKLMGGCSTPISALAQIENNTVIFKGNVCSTDGKEIITIEKEALLENSSNIGNAAADELLTRPGAANLIKNMQNATK